MANQESLYPRRSAPASPIARITEEANDTMEANIDTSMPLSKRVIGESSHVAERRANTSNEMEDDIVDSPGSGVLWLSEDECAGTLSVEIDLPWRLDALDLNYPRAADILY